MLTNENVFELKTLPSTLAVIGAGPLGLELAQAFARLDVAVEVFEESDKIGSLKDSVVRTKLAEILRKDMAIHLNVAIKPSATSDGIELSWSGRSRGQRRFSHVLIAAGRPPALKELKLEATGLELDKHGTPVFDRNTLQCGTSPIFVAGDANADVPVLHEASAEGAIAGRNAARFPVVHRSRRAIPFAITFTDPPCCALGTPPDEGSNIGESDFSNQGRAKVDGCNEGIVRIYADASGKLTGAAMAAPQAEHLAHLVAWAMETGQDAMKLLELPIYHPTFEEGLRTALRQICDKANIAFTADRDEGLPPGI